MKPVLSDNDLEKKMTNEDPMMIEPKASKRREDMTTNGLLIELIEQVETLNVTFATLMRMRGYV